jgi:hypothetical protein
LEIWRSSDGTTWEPCVGQKAKTKEGFGKSGNYDATSMVVKEDQLYVGTYFGVWCSKDGITWNQVTGSPQEQIMAMAAFNGYLYVSVGAKIPGITKGPEIWRGKDTGQWEPVVGPKPASIGAGFADSDVTDITSLAVFGGVLYAGAGRDNPTGNMGISVWRSNDGTTWQHFKNLGGSLHIHAMAPYSGHLYIGGYDSAALYRTNGIPGNWEDVKDVIQAGHNPQKEDGVWCMLPTRRNLYLGVIGADEGKILWRSSNGKSWSAVNTEELGEKPECDAIAVFKGYLYVTTRSQYTAYGQEWDRLEVWRYGKCWGVPVPIFKRPLAAIKPFIRIIPPVLRALNMKVKVNCPECRAPNTVTLGQVQREETVTCTQCNKPIRLVDTNKSVDRTLSSVHDAVDDLKKALEDLA